MMSPASPPDLGKGRHRTSGRPPRQERRSYRARAHSGNRVDRYYDPTTGQFLTIDPLVDQTEFPYSYAGQDPVNGYDLDGTSNKKPGKVGAAIGKIGGAVKGAAPKIRKGAAGVAVVIGLGAWGGIISGPDVTPDCKPKCAQVQPNPQPDGPEPGDPAPPEPSGPFDRPPREPKGRPRFGGGNGVKRSTVAPLVGIPWIDLPFVVLTPGQGLVS